MTTLTLIEYVLVYWQAMIERIKDLEYKLVTRESRPEDRERIAQVCLT